MQPNAKALYLAWLRTNFPDVYKQAMEKAMADSRKPMSGLGGLAGWSDTLNSLVSNVASLANTIVGTKTSLDMLKLNTQRVTQGLPPINADGSIMTVEQMRAAGYPNATIQQIEMQLANSNPLTGRRIGGVPLWVWLAAGGVGIYFIAKR